MLKIINKLAKTTVQHLFSCQLCGQETQQSHSLCKTCWKELPWYNQKIERHEKPIHVALHYNFPVDRIIHKYKYEQQLNYQTLLAHSLLQFRFSKIQAIVPMPISSERLAQRGYNQMLIIANMMSRQLDVPVWQPVVRLAQHSQKGLTRVERLENISEQFEIIKSERKKYQNVLMIDDVVTTGSSINALSQSLEQLACRNIQIACIAAA